MAIDWPAWHFFEFKPHEKQKNHSQEGFFSSDALESSVAALTREAVQNSLDADADADYRTPVRLRIYTSTQAGALPYEEIEGYFRGIWDGAVATSRPDLRGASCPFLVFEDFGTTGLVGDPTEWPRGDAKNANNFMHFFRAEGVSPKREGSRGRRGVGKIVFPMSSRLSAFFALTVRADDTFDDGHGLLLGQAAMEVHQVGTSVFDGDGWWARHPSPSEPPLPLIERELIDTFKADWHLTRTSQPGLSLVIPFLEEAWSTSQILEALVVNYYWAFLANRLQADVEDPSGVPIHVTDTTLRERVTEMADGDAKERISKDLQLHDWVRDATPIVLPAQWAAEPSWSTVKFDEDELKTIQAAFAAEQRVLLRIPIRIATQDGTVDVVEHLKVILASELGIYRAPTFVRGGMVIPHADDSPVSGYRAIVLVDDLKLSMMVGDSEGAAHTGWSASEKSFRGKYKEGKAWLAVIKRSPVEVLKVLTGRGEDRDKTVLEPFFPDPDDDPAAPPVQPGGTGGTGKPPTKTVTTTPPPPGAPRAMVVQEVAGGGCNISMNRQPGAPKPSSATIAFAYKRRKGDSFAGWTREDFVLAKSGGSIKIKVQGATWTAGDNRLDVTGIDPSTFRIELRGFNPNLDLDIRVDSK